MGSVNFPGITSGAFLTMQTSFVNLGNPELFVFLDSGSRYPDCDPGLAGMTTRLLSVPRYTPDLRPRLFNESRFSPRSLRRRSTTKSDISVAQRRQCRDFVSSSRYSMRTKQTKGQLTATHVTDFVLVRGSADR